MNKISSVLVPYDFSPASENALQYALHFIRRESETEIILLHVTPERSSAAAQRTLADRFQQVVDRYQPDTQAAITVRYPTGALDRQIVAAQLATQSDVIIMGTAGATDTDEHAISNSARLVLEADCPVIVVPVGTDHFEVKKIALAVGKDEVDDPDVLDVLLVIARNFDAKIHVLTIYDEGDPAVYADTPNEKVLRYRLERYYDRDAFVISSNIMDALFEYVTTHDIDMLAIIPRNHTIHAEPSSGRLTKLIALQTQVPLLTID
jgi:nucleotide-binding universal stress UspA family protein